MGDHESGLAQPVLHPSRVAGALARPPCGAWLGPGLGGAHRGPAPPHQRGSAGARAGATAMLDISDGLGRDGGRMAGASGVGVTLDEVCLADDVAQLRRVVSEADAWGAVIEGGEEHSLLATFPSGTALPQGWRRIGDVVPGSGVSLRGEPVLGGGWDHFGG